MNEMTDEQLIEAMLGDDLGVALAARAFYHRRHSSDPQPKELPHCAECFEGCPKCQGLNR
jgi:hypothetical protein